MIRDGRDTDGTEVYRIERPKLIDTVFWHHGARFKVTFAGPIELLPFELESVFTARSLECSDPLRHDFHADPVARDESYV